MKKNLLLVVLCASLLFNFMQFIWQSKTPRPSISDESSMAVPDSSVSKSELPSDSLNPSLKSKDPHPPFGSEKELPYPYQMFYGKWKVEKLLDGGTYFSEEEKKTAEAKIGQTIYYAWNKIVINDEVVMENPPYRMCVLPITKGADWVLSFDKSVEDYGVVGKYFTFVYIYQILPHTDETLIFGDRIVIKDNTTLLLSDPSGVYEAKRISYADDPGYYYREEGILQYYGP